MLDIFNDSLSEVSYMADQAGLTYKLSVTERGIQLYLDGYSQKLGQLLRAVLAVMAECSIDTERFGAIKEKRLRHLDNELFKVQAIPI